MKKFINVLTGKIIGYSDRLFNFSRLADFKNKKNGTGVYSQTKSYAFLMDWMEAVMVGSVIYFIYHQMFYKDFNTISFLLMFILAKSHIAMDEKRSRDSLSLKSAQKMKDMLDNANANVNVNINENVNTKVDELGDVGYLNKLDEIGEQEFRAEKEITNSFKKVPKYMYTK